MLKPPTDYFIFWVLVTDAWPSICVYKLTMIGSDNGMSPGRRQAIIWTNAGILLIGPLGKTPVKSFFNQNLYIFIEENIVWKMAAILSRPQCVKSQPLRYACNMLWSWFGRGLSHSCIHSPSCPIIQGSMTFHDLEGEYVTSSVLGWHWR